MWHLPFFYLTLRDRNYFMAECLRVVHEVTYSLWCTLLANSLFLLLRSRLLTWRSLPLSFMQSAYAKWFFYFLFVVCFFCWKADTLFTNFFFLPHFRQQSHLILNEVTLIMKSVILFNKSTASQVLNAVKNYIKEQQNPYTLIRKTIAKAISLRGNYFYCNSLFEFLCPFWQCI